MQIVRNIKMRIGILSLYYNNSNYGGQLQAYAMQKLLEGIGYEAEQVCLVEKELEPISKKQLLFDVFTGRLNILSKIKRRMLIRYKSVLMKKKNIGNEGFYSFADKIPHTKRVYNVETVDEINKQFDVFVFGSDIIWNPMINSYRQSTLTWTYFGDFTNKAKISYAASFGGTNIPSIFLNKAIEHLSDFTAVSVREKSAKNIIESVSDFDVKVVLDPTMMLDRDIWNSFTRDINCYGDYTLAYVLGSRRLSRKISVRIAEIQGNKLVTIPFVGELNPFDIQFGDEQISGLSVPGFLDRIKHARCVVTDSFHAIVFSIIFNVEFVALLRSAETDKGANNARIKDLLSLFKCESRLARSLSECKLVLSNKIDFSEINQILLDNKAECMVWLNDALHKCESESST